MTVELDILIMDKYRVISKKGEGTFSEVLKCQNVSDGTMWACKKLKRRYKSSEQVNNLREVTALRQLAPHANILELHEIMFDEQLGTVVLVCELMQMNLYEFIKGRKQHLREVVVKNYMYQLCKAIEHMHKKGIFHRDVKPENILIKGECLKLADFGSCRKMSSKHPYTEYISTRWYRPPECLLTDGFYTHKMDIWSMGCVLFEIIRFEPLCAGNSEVDQIAKIHEVFGTPESEVLNKLKYKTKNINFNFPAKKGTGISKLIPSASQDCVDLIYAMCAYDPDKRASARQAVRHAFFKDVRKLREPLRTDKLSQLNQTHHEPEHEQLATLEHNENNDNSGNNESNYVVTLDEASEVVPGNNVTPEKTKAIEAAVIVGSNSKQCQETSKELKIPVDDVMPKLPVNGDVPAYRNLHSQHRYRKPLAVSNNHVPTLFAFPSVIGRTKRFDLPGAAAAGGDIKKRTRLKFRQSSPGLNSQRALDMTGHHVVKSTVSPLYLSSLRPRQQLFNIQQNSPRVKVATKFNTLPYNTDRKIRR